jgi:aminoglycoside 2'-N-acetyltransferase I
MAPELSRDTAAFTHDQGLQPVSMLLADDGVVVASLDVLTKKMSHAGQMYQASGLSWVVTDPGRRGSGYGSRLVAAAREHIAHSGSDIGLFTCDRQLRGFYETAGWEVLPDTIVIGGTPDDPFPSNYPGFDKVTLAGLFSDRARQHRADFVGARIELYPGTIDRLW